MQDQHRIDIELRKKTIVFLKEKIMAQRVFANIKHLVDLPEEYYRLQARHNKEVANLSKLYDDLRQYDNLD